MGANTKIEWCDFTFNCWRGCTKVSPGCSNCYAETLSNRNPKTLGVWGPKGTRVVASEAMWREPLKWNKAAAGTVPQTTYDPSSGEDRVTRHVPRERPRVFCASLADVFESWDGPMSASDGYHLFHNDNDFAPTGKPWMVSTCGRRLTMQDVRRRLFDLIDATPNLDWLVLTKRPENIVKMMPPPVSPKVDVEGANEEYWHSEQIPRQNVWLGTSVENQKAKARIDVLRAIPAAVRFLSVEPLLEDLGVLDLTGIHWAIVGGESGPDSRAFDVGWSRSIVEQCKAAGVPVFVKQIGQRPMTRLPDGEAWPEGVGPNSRLQFSGDGFGNYLVLGLRDKKGGDMQEWPADLRVREFSRV